MARCRPRRDTVGLFVRRFRCSGSEFLEARIIPQRIEHRIESEQRGSKRRKLSEKFSVYCFGTSEATIFSKRGSPRSGSNIGCSLRSPYPTPPGICAEYSKMERARL